MRTLFSRRVLALLVVLGCRLAAAIEPSPGMRVLGLEPTVLFPRREPLAQIARLSVANDSGAPLVCDVLVTTEQGAREEVKTVELAYPHAVVDVLVPDISHDTKLRVELRRGDAVLAWQTFDWKPQRKWQVYVVKSSHEDIGYENYIFKKQHEIAQFIDLAREIVRPRVFDVSGAKRDAGYHYVMETLLFQRNYIEERGERAWRSVLENEVKPGRGLSIMGAPSGVHTHWMDYEEIARMSYPARRETRDRFGLDIKTVMIADNPSLSWSGMQAFAASGIKYVGRWGQGWRTGGNNSHARTKLPALFWWTAPDQHHRVLFAWAESYLMTFWWGQTDGGFHGDDYGLPGRWMNQFLQRMESGVEHGPYPYDAMIIPSYIDHETPKFGDRIYDEWRKAYAYPEVKFEHPEKFFTYIEEKYGDELPVLSGDLNNFSADYASIDPVSQDWKRRAARLLPAAEGIGAVASAADPAFALSLNEIERIYTRMYDYDEHSWPTLPAVSDEQLFNATWVKNHEARRAFDGARAVFAEAATALGRQIAAPGKNTIAVFNPLVHQRSDLVEIALDADAVVDQRNGEVVACERTVDGRRHFLARNVPAFGYALYRAADAAATPAAATELQAEPHAISNRHYTVRFDPASGGVVSIVDKDSGRELVDAGAPYRVNQLVYVHKEDRFSTRGFDYTPARATRMAPRLERAQVAFDVWIDDTKLGGRVRQTVSLHAGVKRVEFENRLESIDAMWARTHADRYRDNLFFAFPFAVPHGQIRAEYPGGVVRPHDDQLRWGSHDYLYANRWIDVSNAEGGVTLAAAEAGTFSLGEIRYNQFSIDYRPTKPWLFSYAWSNRMAGLLTLDPEDCNATFRYALTSHTGDWTRGIPHGWEVGSPLLAVPVTGTGSVRWTQPTGSFLTIDARHVQLSVFKAAGQAGRGWIARFVETEGRGGEFELDASHFGVERAQLCNLVEDDLGELPVTAGKVRVSIRPFGFATVRLLGGGAPPKVEGVKPAAVSDSRVHLRWTPVDGATVAYNVYRSDDPDAPATVYSLIERTAASEISDTALNLSTDYYYRVAAVTAANIEGPLSDRVVVRTSSTNASPPAPVRELGVVRRSANSLIVYWRRSPEPDVARYRIFRGERPDFSLVGREPVATLDATDYFLQVYRDVSVEPGKTYHYRIQPVDWSDNRQSESPVAGATTPAKAS